MTHRVILFTGDGCSLCEEAVAVLEQIGHPYEKATDPAYRERIPVVSVDGKVISEGPVNGRAIRRALR